MNVKPLCIVHAVCLFALALFSIAPASAKNKKIFDTGARELFLSSDGKTIGFTLGGRLWTIPEDGGRAEPLTPGFGLETGGEFTEDDEHVVFVRERSNVKEVVALSWKTGYEYVIAPAPQWNAQQIGELRKLPQNAALPRSGMSVQPVLGPYGKSLIAKVPSDDGTGSKTVAVDISTRATSEIDEIYHTISAQYQANMTPWSKDGRFGLTHRLVPVFGAEERAYEARRAQERAEERKKTGGYVTKTSRHKDISRLIFIDVEKKKLKPLLESRTTSYRMAQFSADDTSIFAIEIAAGQERIVEFDLNGKNRRVIVEGLLAARDFVVHPNGKTLLMAADGKISSIRIKDGKATPIPFTAHLEDHNITPDAILITNARLFVGDTDTARKQANVLVQDGVVTSVSYGKPNLKMAKGAKRIDAGGQFLMAGLVASHEHFTIVENPYRYEEVLRAGITTAIDPSADYNLSTPDRRIAVETGHIKGPRVYYFSPKISGITEETSIHKYISRIDDPEIARALVRRYKKLGFTGMKLGAPTTPHIGAAIIDEGKKIGMMTIGHLGAMSWTDAVDAGIDSITHSSYYLCDTRGSDASGIRGLLVAPDRECLTKIFAKMAKKGVTYDPTGFVPHPDLWPKEEFEKYIAYFPNYPYQKILENKSKVIRMAHDAGVNIVIGRDNFMYAYPIEMAVYERAGIPRPDILRMATINAARFLKKEEEFGTVEVGKRADLIVVDGDPLKRIKDLHNITMVVKGGEVIVNRLGALGSKKVH